MNDTTMEQTEQEVIIKIKGKLDRKLFPKNKLNNGDFGILSIKVEEEIEGVPRVSEYGNIVIKGVWCEMNTTDEYTIIAKEVEHPTYGKQYELLYVSAEMDFSTPKAQRTYLEKILTEKQVKALYDTLKNPFEAIEKGDIETLCSVKGIGNSTAQKVIDKYRQNIDYSEVLIKLDGYGLTQRMVHKLVEKYGSPSIVVGKVKENVYILADEVDGIGFKKADEIAVRMGMNPHSPNRVKAFIYYYLNNQAEQGNSWVYTDKLFAQIYEVCGEDIDKTIIQSVLREMVGKGSLWASNTKEHIGLMRYFKLEQEIDYHIRRLAGAENKFKYDDWEEVVANIEKRQGWNYTDEQKAGIKAVLDNPVVVVTGLAGTGKSTVTNAMIEILRYYQIKQCALSGRASQRMKEVNGLESNTIHKTLGYMYGDTWTYDENFPLDVDILLVDEASMINGDIFLRILRALRTGTKLVVIGDYGQLPTIGNCNVFLDMMNIGLPLVKLTVVHRQAQASAIISKSIDIRKQVQLFDRYFEGTETLGELQDLNLFIYQDKNAIKNMIVKRFEQHFVEVGKDVLKVQIVVPMKTRGSICTQALNEEIQQLINPNTKEMKQPFEVNNKKFFVGDKVINNTNKKVLAYPRTEDEDEVQIYNGNIGIVLAYNLEKGIMLVDFGEQIGRVILDKSHIAKSLDLGYAITCHKLQGSSCERVIVGLDYSAYTMLTSEWIYTAITRAESLCDLVAENSAVRYAISQVQSNDKQTFLPFVKELRAS